MSLILLPAIDLRGGRCVRLLQGDYAKETIYNDDPVAQALQWQNQGAQIIHLVDLDGAREGAPKNLDVIRAIVREVTVATELGGGIRTMETVEEVLTLGVSRVIIGTAAIKNPDLLEEAVRAFGPNRIVLGLDAKDGKVAISGWEATAEKSAIELALEMKARGLTRIIYTDISKDGMMQGPNLEATRELAEQTGLKVIASGGFASYDDIENCADLVRYGVEGAILGKSLYTGAVELPEALSLLQFVREGE